MSILTPKIPDIKKETPRHPWEKVINPALSHKIKYAHNTVNNIKYPEGKKKLPHKDRVKFTVIGDRVTKEFIYCSHIVKGLHKYHWQVFDEPVIRGVSTVEWPDVLHDLKLKYGGLAYCLDTQVAIIINDKFLGGDKVLCETIEAKYRYYLNLDFYKEGVDNFISYIRSAGRPCVYMHILIDEEHIGTLIFMLYSDVVPYTCENFLRLCQATKGGYSGTPVHRIVKDGWIQCGGYGLKSSELDCENYIIPHDRRGVLGMANDGRNVDCSTQFFVLLQPSTWMTHKYVAFGQLIDGEQTLHAIEEVPTWYESPTSDIIIHKAGILNVECDYMPINKGTHEYVQGHIEDLVAVGEVFYEELIAMVFITLEIKRQKRDELAFEELYVNEETVVEEGDDKMNIRATKRFLRKKEDIDNVKKPASQSMTSDSSETPESEVEDHLEGEEIYLPMSRSSVQDKPERPYYIPFTDVPYPDEVDSVFDFKRFLQGDYCLESDLESKTPCKVLMPTLSYISEKFYIDISEQASNVSLNSEDEIEFKKYIKMNVDRVSFAGDMIKSIAKCALGRHNIFDNTNKSDLITDEELRRFRLASIDYRGREHHPKKVSLSVPDLRKAPKKIKRRPTGFVRPEDLEKIRTLHRLSSDTHSLHEGSDTEEYEDVRKVRIAPSAIATQLHPKTTRRLTGFELPKLSDSDKDLRRPSAFRHLYENIINMHPLPMLKDLKEKSPDVSKMVFLTTSPDTQIKSDQNVREKYLRHSLTLKQSYEEILNFQHGKKVAHKISSDYVKTIDQIEQKVENSLRSVEYAKTRPSMSVSAYQEKNRQYEESKNKEEKKNLANPNSHSLVGIRLPGDTPLPSEAQMVSQDEDK